MVKYGLLLYITLFCSFNNLYSQAFEPRFLSDIPIKGNFIVAGYGYSKGDILLDPASPVQDLKSNLNNVFFAYARSLKLFNKLVRVDAVIPFAIADFNGVLNGEAASTSRTGFGDPMFRVSMIIIGSEALELKDFIKYKPKKFKFGVGLRISPPLGQYNSTKLINLGTNRWTFKIGVGAQYTFIKKIIIEGQLKTWFFTQNNEFYNGDTLRQSPLFSAQLHFTYIFKPGIWISGSVGQTNSGTTYVNGVEQEKLQKNSKFGITYSYRINKKNAVKIALTNGIPNYYAIDYTSIIVAYTFLWFDK